MADAKDRCATKLRLRVKPRASRTEISGIDPDGRVRVRVKAAPVDGAANKELLRFLGRKVLGIAPSTLSVVSGQNARDKVIAIDGLGESEVRRALRRFAESGG